MRSHASDILLHGVLAGWLAAAVSCSASAPVRPDSLVCGGDRPPPAEHQLVGRVFSGPAQTEVSIDVLIEALVRARYVVLGETHDNPTHHDWQARLLKAFLAEQPTAAVAFEMLDEDDASSLASAPRSADELAERVAWAQSGWPDFRQYKPVFEVALAAHAQLVAAHPSKEHVRASMHEIDGAEARDLHIDTPLPDEQVQAQYEEIREAHCGHASGVMLAMMQNAQVYKDAFMARALARTGTPAVLIAGRGHARKDRAVPFFLRRMEAGPTLSIALIEVSNTQLEPTAYDTQAFDYVVFTPSVHTADPCEEFRKQLEKMHQNEHGTDEPSAPPNNTNPDGTR